MTAIIPIDELMLLRRIDVADDTMIDFGGGVSIGIGRGGDEDYWAYRVQLTDKQAVIGFPKFGTIGVGFLRENDDWNSNLPYSSPVVMIADHIRRNRFVDGEDIPRANVERALTMIRDAVGEDRGGPTCVTCRNIDAAGSDHWPEDCPRPLSDYEQRRRAQFDEARGTDGWPVDEDEDE